MTNTVQSCNNKVKKNHEYNELKRYDSKHINRNGEETRKKTLDILLNRVRDGVFKGTNKELLIKISKLMDVNVFHSFKNR